MPKKYTKHTPLFAIANIVCLTLAITVVMLYPGGATAGGEEYSQSELDSQAQIGELLEEKESLTAEIERLRSENETILEENAALREENLKLTEQYEEVKFDLDQRQETLVKVIRQVCNQRDFDYRIAVALAIKESGINPAATNKNRNGTQDYGMYQFNDVMLEHLNITEEIARDPYMSTVYFCIIMENLLEKYDNDLHYALRCYGAGERGARNGGGHRGADKVIKILGEI